MPRRGGARRARARRTRRANVASHAARRRRNRRRNHRTNFNRSRGTTRIVTGAHNSRGISTQQSTSNCISVLLVIGMVLVGVGLILTFQISSFIGIAPISLGALCITASLALYFIHRNKPINRTVQVTATLAPQNTATIPVDVQGANVLNPYTDEAPSYSTAIPSNTGMQYGGFEYATSVNPEPPPPSYAEATMKAT